MHHPRLTLGHTAWMMCALLLLLPNFAASGELSLTIDFDSDGRHDRVVLDRQNPAVLRVWLSASDTTQVIHARVALVRVIATDLDGDHRPELIATDSNSQIHVWTRKRKGFHSYRPRNAAPAPLKQPTRRRGVDWDTESPGAIPSGGSARWTWAPCPSPSALTPRRAIPFASHTVRACESSTAVTPFAPRPPPTPGLPS